MTTAAHLRLPTVLIDDAFITFRYAANWARGDGLTYNVGQHVLGTTTPGYALLIGTIARLTGTESIPLVARVLNLVALLAAAACFGTVSYRITGSSSIALAVVSFALLSPNTLVASVSGMESSIMLALLGLGCIAWQTQRRALAAFALGLLPLVRPEGVFVIGLAGLAIIISSRRSVTFPSLGRLVGLASLMLFPGLIWLVTATLYYGSPIPHSVIAKRAGLYPIGLMGSVLSFGDSLLKSFTLTPLIDDGRNRLLLLSPIPFLVILIAALCVIGLGALIVTRKYRRAWPAAALVAILMGFYLTSGTLVFPHYHTFYELFAKIFWWAGLFGLSQALVRRWTRSATMPRTAIALAGITALVAQFPSFWLFPWRAAWTGELVTGELGLQAAKQIRYRTLALELGPRLPPETVALMSEIGELGFYLQVEVLDSAGLVSPEALSYLPAPAELQPGGIPPALVRDQRPDLVISAASFCEKGLLRDPWFVEHYEPVVLADDHRFVGDMGVLYVFARHDFAPGIALRNSLDQVNEAKAR